MKKIIVLKNGDSLPGLVAGRGDFEDWFMAGMGLDPSLVQVVDARKGEALPGIKAASGVVVTGSHERITDLAPWMLAAADWLKGAVAGGKPILGVCFGHQLVAYALGGEVGDNPAGPEMGNVAVCLTKDANEDPLLGGLPQRARVFATHSQSVRGLPPGAVLLARNDHEGCQAFRYGNRAWGLQFHPEFDAEITRAYVDEYSDYLREYGQDPEALLASCDRPQNAGGVLARFASLCGL